MCPSFFGSEDTARRAGLGTGPQVAGGVADQDYVEISGRRAAAVFTVKVLLSAVVMAATTTMFSLFVWTLLPFTLGWSPSVVVTGSMEPSIAPGDIVVTAPVEPAELRLGYVIRFKDPSDSHPYLLHRLIKINPDGTLVTKGDANQSEDSTPVPTANVTGVARLRVPLIGLPAVWLRNGQFLQLGLVLLAVAFSARVLTGLRGLVSPDQAAGTDPQERTGVDAEPPPAGPVDGQWAEGLVPAVDRPGVEVAPGAALAGPAADPDLLVAAAGSTTDGGTGVDAAAGTQQPAPGPAVGRHRGQGRASWRRDRTSTRPRSRSRHRRRDRAGAAGD
jgi:signal peptidase I